MKGGENDENLETESKTFDFKTVPDVERNVSFIKKRL